MKADKYNKSEIMKEAWELYRFNRSFNWSFGRCLTTAWRNAKQRIINAEVKVKNEAMWKARVEERRQDKIKAEKAKIEASDMDVHTYFMTEYYNRNGYQGD